ncbi:hypothetical protein L873DRAFT_167798 [Choiromyces venosus 120613-1]|uniref:Uncharacterized protein n=1 Tax=Choiromyces venosus 120613-1 TaxID=1336337 RepID=A0A3N4JYZ8_9PEZI|nr:hypothetical protein L873DRAFT_167798 [Choiromyces venosus 120613-1]
MIQKMIQPLIGNPPYRKPANLAASKNCIPPSRNHLTYLTNLIDKDLYVPNADSEGKFIYIQRSLSPFPSPELLIPVARKGLERLGCTVLMNRDWRIMADNLYLKMLRWILHGTG